jgi:hypothetical protein
LTDEPRGPGTGPPDDEDPDTGQPIEVLADLESPTRPGFMDRVRNRIERRSVTSQFLTFSWHLPKVVILEFLEMLFEMFSPPERPRGDSS